MHELQVYSWVIVTGFVCAGFSHAVYQSLTNKVMSFDISNEKGLKMLASLLTLIFAGPFILVRNSIRGVRLENRHGGWVVASAGISVLWSLMSGGFLLNIYLTTIA